MKSITLTLRNPKIPTIMSCISANRPIAFPKLGCLEENVAAAISLYHSLQIQAQPSNQ